MMTQPENQRYDHVITQETSMEQDRAIEQASVELGQNFGRYDVLSNNCTEYSANCLERGGWNVGHKTIPNLERSFLMGPQTIQCRTYSSREAASRNKFHSTMKNTIAAKKGEK